jgi:type IV secretory pathway VirJ component
MRRFLTALLVVFVLLLGGAAAADAQSLRYGRFGSLHVFGDTKNPAHVSFFFSGDGGWGQSETLMAQTLALQDSLVVGIDSARYLKALDSSKDSCLYPAADLEGLSKFVQKSYSLPAYLVPLVAGYSAGAALAYASLVQAPRNTFAGALSLGFCPDLAVSKPLCGGSGLETKRVRKGELLLLPAKSLPAPWIVLNGELDSVCDVASAQKFVDQVPGAELIELPDVGHGFGTQPDWAPELQAAFERVTEKYRLSREPSTPTADEVKGLPLIELPAQSSSPLLAVILSGDGGWAAIDRQMGEYLKSEGVSVVGVNTLQYFWTPRTPDSSAVDLVRVLHHYLASWGKSRAVLIGYSLGADVLPFMANRLPRDLLDRVSLIVLLGPSRSTRFDFSVAEWLGVSSSKGAFPVLPEVRKLKGTKVLCLSGSDEKNSLCGSVGSDTATSIALPGGHHFGGNYREIVRIILQQIPDRGTP